MTNKNKLPTEVPSSLVVASSIGTILEWYDFTLYAYLAPIISMNFFPNGNSITSVMLVYSVFAIGFIVRPIGAMIFGHFGDRIGRKKVLVFSIVMMASATFLIGILPTYAHIGLAAPALLILLRIFQGISIGGETIGAGLLVIESTPPHKRGFATALVWASSGIGILLSSIVISIITWIFSQQELSDWAWRVPFVLGATTGIMGYYLRKNISESSVFRATLDKKEIFKIPLFEAIRTFKKELLITICLYSLCAITTYLLFVFMPMYVSTNFGIPLQQAMVMNTLAMACMVVGVPIVGRYSDLLGNRNVLMISTTAFIILSYPLYLLISTGSLLNLGIAQLVFSVLTAGFQGPITSTVLEMFPSNVRYSGAAFGYNISYSLFGGTAPIVAVYLVSKLENSLAPSFYLISGAIVAFISILGIKQVIRSINNNAQDMSN